MAIDINKVRVLKHFGQSYYPVAHAESTIYRNGPNQKDRETVAEALNTIVKNVSTINSGLSNRYTKTEVNNLLDLYISRIHLFEYVNVDGYQANLPQASESTMYKIYLVKASNSEVANIKDEFITLKTPLPICLGNVEYFGPSDGASKPSAEMINEGDILIYSDNPLDADSYEIKKNGNLEGYSASAGDIIVDTAHNKYYTMNNNGTAWVQESGQPTYTYSWEQIGSTAIDVSNKINTVTGADDYIPKFNSSGQLVSSGVTSNGISDAVSKRHSHSNITLSTSAQAYDGSHTIQLPANDPYSTARTPSSHPHGNISNSGTLTDTAAAAETNDKLVIRDASNNAIQTSNIKATEVAEAVANRTFVARYFGEDDNNNTSFNAIDSAFQAGLKVILCILEDGAAKYVSNVRTNDDRTYYRFVYTEGLGTSAYNNRYTIDAEGGWTVETTPLQVALTFDNTPTANSNNPVKSGGVYDYIDTLSASIQDIQSIFTA